jgi:hypothetical protein
MPGLEDDKNDDDVDDTVVEDDKTDKPEKKEEPKLSKSEWQAQFEADVLPKRLQRKEKEVLKALGLNSLDEYATIKTKADQADQLAAASQTEEEKRAARDAQRDAEFAALKNDIKARDYKILVGEIADELEIPKRLRSFLKGDDEESLRESAEALLDAMSEFGGAKNDPKKKTTQDSVTEKKVVHGGGGKKPDVTIDPKALAKKIYESSGGVLAR